jgi:signal transduction histidine kinase
VDQRSNDQPARPATSGLVIAVVLFCLLVIASLWVAVEYVTRNERENRLREVKQENANLARVLEEHTIRTLAYVDELALLMKERFEREGAQFDLPTFFNALQVPKALVRNAVITDESGYVVLGSHGAPRTYLGDREHIHVHTERDTKQLFIGKPVLARVNGNWSIIVTRRANKPDGSLLGVIGIAIDPFYFSNFYKDVDLGRGGIVALVGADGIIRVRLPPGDERGMGADISKSVLFQLVKAAPHGTYVAPAVTDGVERIYAYRLIQDFPLIVTVGTSFVESLAPVYAEQRRYRLLATAGTVLLIAIAFALAHLVRRRDHAEAAAHHYLQELHRKAIQLETARSEAEAGSRAKSQFLATMSHEIRTPMNGVMGTLELLQRSSLAPEQRRFAQTAYDSAAALLRVLNDILDFSRMEAGRLTLELAPFDPRAPLREVTSLFNESARAKGVELKLDIADDVPVEVLGDAGRMRQIVMNLVSNALKFTSAGRVEVRLLHVQSDPPDIGLCRLRIEVSDTGIGMSNDEQTRLFVPFSQGDASTTRRFGGSGLGLAICRHLVDLMEGKIGVSSAPGRGSTFWFEVALKVAPAASARAVARA